MPTHDLDNKPWMRDHLNRMEGRAQARMFQGSLAATANDQLLEDIARAGVSRERQALDLITAGGLLKVSEVLPSQKMTKRETLLEIAETARRASEHADDDAMVKITATTIALLVAELLP